MNICIHIVILFYFISYLSYIELLKQRKNRYKKKYTTYMYKMEIQQHRDIPPTLSAQNEFSNIQYYHPILHLYSTESNTCMSSLVYNDTLDSIIEKETPSKSIQVHDIYKIKTQKNNIVRCFFKVTPIVDPIYYLSGQYGSHIPFVLPQPNHKKWKKKVKWNSLYKSKCVDVNNVAYMDMFFNYIVSVCLSSFIHKVELYDSFSCIKKQMVFNIEDDFYSLRRNTYYKNMKDISFKVEFGVSIPREHTCKFREKELKIEDNKDSTCDISNDIEDIEDIEDTLTTSFEKLTLHKKQEKVSSIHNIENEIEDITDELNFESLCIDVSNSVHKRKRDDECDCKEENNRVNHKKQKCFKREDTHDVSMVFSDEEGMSLYDEGDEGDEGDCSDEDDEDHEIFAIFNEFPVQVTCLECIDITLDKYMEETIIGDEHWKAILFQIIMILTTYQKCFDFTHNDLHTENIMLKKTTIKYINYKFENTYYRVPTFGYICKIIDFGRANFRYGKHLFCSDSYSKDGDATGQYNYGPYYNRKKEKRLPNYSFDLCRLSCSLLDHFLEKDRDVIDTDLYCEVNSWSKDANGKSILYKQNFQERFPGFQLYIMIAKLAQSAIPKDVIKHKIFQSFNISHSNIKNITCDNEDTYVINVDDLPICYTL